MNRLTKVHIFLLASCLLAPAATIGQAVSPRQPYLGLRAVSAGTAQARELGIESPSGAAIQTITSDGPAAKAGLQRGDLIVQFGGKEIGNVNNLEAAARRSPIGSKQRVVFVRKNRRFHADLIIGSRENAATHAGGAKSGKTPPAPQPSGIGNVSPKANAITAGIVQAMKFRADAASDFAKAMKQHRTDKAMNFLIQSGNPLTQARSIAWSAFFTGSLVLMGHADSPEPVVAFYNPLYDAVLLTRWAGRANGGEMTAADLRVASAWASGGNGALPPYAAWLQGAVKRPAPEVIASEHGRFLKTFERAFPPKATSIARIAASPGVEKAVAFVEVQALKAIGDVAAVQRTGGPRYNGRIPELRKALVQHDKNALARLTPPNSPTSVASLLEIPEEYSRHLVPCYAALGEKDSIVVLQDTIMPRYYMMIFFRHGATAAQTEIRSVFFFELAQDVRGGDA
jgi:hypothetical protein